MSPFDSGSFDSHNNAPQYRRIASAAGHTFNPHSNSPSAASQGNEPFHQYCHRKSSTGGSGPVLNPYNHSADRMHAEPNYDMINGGAASSTYGSPNVNPPYPAPSRGLANLAAQQQQLDRRLQNALSATAYYQYGSSGNLQVPQHVSPTEYDQCEQSQLSAYGGLPTPSKTQGYDYYRNSFGKMGGSGDDSAQRPNRKRQQDGRVIISDPTQQAVRTSTLSTLLNNTTGGREVKASLRGYSGKTKQHDQKLIRTTASGAKRILGYNPDFSDEEAPPVTARLPACELSAVELLFLFPNHTQWPKAILRLIGNSWTTEEIAGARLYARGKATDKDIHRVAGALRYQVTTGGKLEFPTKSHWTTKNYPAEVVPTVLYNVSAYVPRPKQVARLQTIKLIDISEKVVNWPAPEDRGIVTKAVLLAKELNNHVWTTDHVPAIAAMNGWSSPVEATGTQWDQSGRRRVRSALEAAGIWLRPE